MNNHDHGVVVTKEENPSAEASETPRLADFYMELKKKITETVKALTGLRHLSLWEDRTGVVLVPTLKDAIKRMVYVFSNPAAADLAESIDTYKGFNTWKDFISCEPSIDARVDIPVRWYPVQEIPLLPENRILTEQEDAAFVEQLLATKGAVPHTLTIQPLAWLRPFGITDPARIEEIRQEVIQGVRENERQYAAERQQEGRRVIPTEKLQQTPYLRPHTPKEKGHKINVVCGEEDLRCKWLGIFKSIAGRCRDCYQELKRGGSPKWPDGTFVPWLPPSTGQPWPRFI
jgi:hypothetical protein